MRIKSKDIPRYGSLALAVLTIVFSVAIWVVSKGKEIDDLNDNTSVLQCQIQTFLPWNIPEGSTVGDVAWQRKWHMCYPQQSNRSKAQ